MPASPQSPTSLTSAETPTRPPTPSHAASGNVFATSARNYTSARSPSASPLLAATFSLKPSGTPNPLDAPSAPLRTALPSCPSPTYSPSPRRTPPPPPRQNAWALRGNAR
eukprot:2735348-Pleurochrysis_carterae.AAC.1